MNITLKALITFALFLTLFPVLAVDQIPRDRTISIIHTYHNSFAVVRFTPSYDNNLGCDFKTAVVIDWSSNPEAKVQLALALVAYSNGNKIGFGITGPCHGWGGGTPIAYRIDVSP